MRYNLCSCCMFFHPDIKDENRIVKKHCMASPLREVFGEKFGFPSGVDIVCCDYFRQPSFSVCDVVYSYPNFKNVGFIIPSVRPKTRRGVSGLYDNSKNQKINKML